MRTFVVGLILLVCVARGVDNFVFHDHYWSLLTHAKLSVAFTPAEVKDKKLAKKAKLKDVTQEEQYQIKQDLLRQLYSATNAEEVILRDGRKFQGTRISDNGSVVVFRQLFGKSGTIETKINKRDIAQIKPIERTTGVITEDEVLIKKTFYDFKFTRQGNYSFFSDEDYFRASAVASLVTGLHDGVVSTFRPLIEGDINRRSYVLVFGDGQAFYELCRAIAPGIKGAVGFYSPGSDYLVVYDFFNGRGFRAFNSYLRWTQAKLSDDDASDLQAAQSRFALDMKAENIAVVRHEGAHQLSFDLGILNNETSDIWVAEGFAEYCSTPYIGKPRQEHIDFAAHAMKHDRYIPLNRLFELSDGESFYRQNEYDVGLSYAESWLYFYYLMQPDRREKFFSYLAGLKKSKNLNAAERLKKLGEAMDISAKDLDEAVKTFARQNKKIPA